MQSLPNLENLSCRHLMLSWEFKQTCKGFHINKTILKKKNKDGGFTHLDFNIQHKAVVTEALWYQCRNRLTDKWNRTENPEINPHT